MIIFVMVFILRKGRAKNFQREGFFKVKNETKKNLFKESNCDIFPIIFNLLYKQFSSTGPTPAPRSNVGGSVAGGSIPDDKTLQKIAVKVYNKDWVRLANKLDFEFEDIEEFKSQNNDKRSQVRNLE